MKHKPPRWYSRKDGNPQRRAPSRTVDIRNERPRRSKPPRAKFRAPKHKPSGATPRERRPGPLRRPAGGQILSTIGCPHPQWLLTLLASSVTNSSVLCACLGFPGARWLGRHLTHLGSVQYGPTWCGLRQIKNTSCRPGPGLCPPGAAPPLR